MLTLHGWGSCSGWIPLSLCVICLVNIETIHIPARLPACEATHWLTDWLRLGVKVIPAVSSQYNWLLQPQASRRAQPEEKKLFFAEKKQAKRSGQKYYLRRLACWLQWAMWDSCYVRPDLIFSRTLPVTLFLTALTGLSQVCPVHWPIFPLLLLEKS